MSIKWLDSAYCPDCSGSGEGQYDGTRCRTCGGSGEVPVDEDGVMVDDEDPPEYDGPDDDFRENFSEND